MGKENAALNRLENAPIRWIIEDVQKFLGREIKRGKKYDAIILDPPSFGRGSKGEVFKIEEDLGGILRDCRTLLSQDPLFVLFSGHTPGFTPLVNAELLEETMQGLPGVLTEGEMLLTKRACSFPLPSGTFARWSHGGSPI